MNNQQLIKKYFNNTLSIDERKRLDMLLENDQDFKREFEEHKSLHRAFEINEAEQLKRKLKDIESNNTSQPPSNSSKHWFLPMAAMVLVILGLSVYLSFFNTNLYDEYFEIYPNVYQPVVRSTSQSIADKAFVYYENKKYEKAQQSFELLLKSNPNPNIQFYYALSLLNDGKTKKASTEFENLLDTNFEFQPEVYWYYALAEIKLENLDQAKTILQTAENLNFSFKAKERKKILKDL